MADKKYVHLQGEPSKVREKGLKVNVMVKQAVIYDGKDAQGRHSTLQNRIVYSSIDGNFWDNSLDIITQRNDINKIKNIHISGDGAKRITSSTSTIPKSIYYLDKFHYKQALLQMLLDANERWITESYTNNNWKKQFIDVATSLISLDSMSQELNTRYQKWTTLKTTGMLYNDHYDLIIMAVVWKVRYLIS